MADLVSATAILIGISILLGCAAWAFARNRSRPVRQAVLFGLVGVLLFFLWKFRGQLVMTWLFPVSSAVILSDLAVPMLGIMIGFLVATREVPRWRRAIVCTILTLSALYPFWFVFSQRPPVAGEEWEQGVCLQTSMATCGPAAAATLLATAGISANEGEMSDLCRTGHRGATLLGIYRGLKLKTAGTRWDVEQGVTSLDELLACRQWPLLVRVELKRGEADPRYERFFGWSPGVGHVVVIFHRLRNGLFMVGDPSIGTEYWNERDLEVLWHGDSLRLVDRDRRSVRNSEERAIAR